MPHWEGWERVNDMCRIPPKYPSNFYGIYTITEIISIIMPYFIVVTIWRIIFTKVLGNYIGKPIAKKVTKFDINHNKIPSLYLLNNDNIKKETLNELYNDIQPKILSELKLNRNANKTSLIYLNNNEKDRILNELKIPEIEFIKYFNYKDGLRDVIGISNKFNEELWKLITVLVIVFYGMSLVFDNELQFFKDPHSVYYNWPQIINDNVIQYYAMQAGYHMNRAVWFKSDGKDKIAMFIHHWVTLVLIFGSWYYGFMQIGVLVFIVHDNADIWLPMGKIGKWLNWNIFKTVGFICLAISWPLTRIILYTKYVIYPLIKTGYIHYGCTNYAIIMISIFTVLLVTLLILHIYWFYFLIKAVIKVINGGTIDDTRNEDHKRIDNNQ